VVLLDCFELTLFLPSRIEYYDVFELISVLAYMVKVVDFGPIAIFKIHCQFRQFWAHCCCRHQASISPTSGSSPLSTSSINLADFGLIAIADIKPQSCQLWAHCRHQRQALILLTSGSLPSLRSSVNLTDFGLIAVVDVKS
jgi:hypothetical protein